MEIEEDCSAIKLEKLFAAEISRDLGQLEIARLCFEPASNNRPVTN